MKVPKEKSRVRITCKDATLVEGFVHIREGLRLSDNLNIERENFITLTDMKVSNAKIMSFGLHKAILPKKKEFIVLNKNSIKWVEEI